MMNIVAGLALADSVNPCTLGVLSILLVTIMSYSPKNKLKILSCGVAFTSAIYMIYLLYGIGLTYVFQLAKLFELVSKFLFPALGGVALLVGILHILDFLRHTGSCKFAPQISKRIKKISGVKSSVVLGILCSILLLPCTIGPYVVVAGVLSDLTLTLAAFWLVFYNFVFIVPMVLIILMVWFGLSTIKNINEWEARNIPRLTLLAGLLMSFLGIAMVYKTFTGICLFKLIFDSVKGFVAPSI